MSDEQYTKNVFLWDFVIFTEPNIQSISFWKFTLKFQASKMKNPKQDRALLWVSGQLYINQNLPHDRVTQCALLFKRRDFSSGWRTVTYGKAWRPFRVLYSISSNIFLGWHDFLSSCKIVCSNFFLFSLIIWRACAQKLCCKLNTCLKRSNCTRFTVT
jgi:hypothetical protein